VIPTTETAGSVTLTGMEVDQTLQVRERW